MHDYDLRETANKLDLNRLLKPLLAAEQGMARVNERLRTLPFRDGVIERLVYHEACALSYLEGKLVPVEDLVHAEAGASVKMGYRDLSVCHEYYAVLRCAWLAAPEPLLTAPSPGDGLERLRIPEGQRNEVVHDRNWGEGERLAAWRQVERDAGRLPAPLAAAFVWDAWQMLQPEQHGLWKSWLLASLTLKARKAFGQGLLPLAWGAMHANVQWDKRFPVNLRVEQFLEAVTAACERTGQEIVRLSHADALMARRIEGLRKGSKVPQLKDLLLRRPVVSAGMIRKTLKVSPQAVSDMVKQLAPVPREVTGRRSYRVWGI
jgi:Protein of unknown function (DUF1612)/HTH DNA binding domain